MEQVHNSVYNLSGHKLCCEQSEIDCVSVKFIHSFIHSFIYSCDTS